MRFVLQTGADPQSEHGANWAWLRRAECVGLAFGLGASWPGLDYGVLALAGHVGLGHQNHVPDQKHILFMLKKAGIYILMCFWCKNIPSSRSTSVIDEQ